MRPVLCAALLVLGCATGPPLEGAWQSDRERTLEALSQVEGLTEAQRELITIPDFFGQMIHVYSGGEAFTVFDDRCGYMAPFEVIEATPNSQTVRYFNGYLQRKVTITMELDHETLWVPIPILPEGSREAFRRISLAEARAAHPCLDELLTR